MMKSIPDGENSLFVKDSKFQALRRLLPIELEVWASAFVKNNTEGARYFNAAAQR